MAITESISKLKLLKNIFKGDKVIWTVFFVLCMVSIIEVYSSSSVLGYKSGNYWYAAVFHTGTLVFGMLLMVAISTVPCKYFRRAMPFCALFSVITLLWVLVWGTKINGAARWIDLGLFQLQPSEFAKGTMVLVTAHILAHFQTPDGTSPKAFKNILIAGAFLILPIIPENFSTGFLLASVIFMMMLIGRIPARQIGKLCSVCAAGAAIFLFLVFTVGESRQDAPPMDNGKQLTEVVAGTPKTEETPKIKKFFHRFDVWRTRFDKFFNDSTVAPKDYDLDKNAQEGYSCIAIASSNVIGKGPGNSEIRDFLPLAFSDFIFAVIFEELGMVGAVLVVLLYIILLFRTGYIARQCVNAFPAYLAMGLALLIVVQAFFNMAVAVGLVPVTGQPLPLISKGGTSSIINCIYIGMIISVSKTAQKREKAS